MKKISLISFLSFTAIIITVQLNACEIKLSPVILFLSTNLKMSDLSSLYTNSNCSPEITTRILEKLSTSNGKIISQNLIESDDIKYNETNLNERSIQNIDVLPATVSISPEIIETINLSEIIKLKNKNILFDELEVLNLGIKKSYALPNIDALKIECAKCNTNELLWKISLTENTLPHLPVAKQITFYAKTKSYKLIKTLKAKSDITSLSNNLSADQFDIVFEKNEDSSNLFDLEKQNLVHFTNLANIKAGELLNLNMISLKKIVHMGKEIEAVVQSKEVQISIQAKALESGVFGQVINIENPKNKKKLSGEIIGPNKVLINL